MSVILRLGAVNNDTPYSKLINDASEYDAPIDMSSPGDDDQHHSPPQTYPGCFGLPYQDHNYGAPPPPSPPPSPPPVKISNSFDVNEEVVVTSDVPTPPSPPVPLPQQLSPPKPPPTQKLKSLDEQVDDSITRCICDFIHDDGYMICCDRCSVWQHIVCMGLDRDSIPDTYYCEECEPRPVDRVTAREIQVRKREFLKTLLVHDSSETDTDPEEVNNRMRAQGLSPTRKQQKLKLKKRKEKLNLKQNKKKIKLLKKEKENNNREANKRPKLILKNFPMKAARKEKQLAKKVTTPVIQNEDAQEPWEEPPQKEALDLSLDHWDVNKDIWATSNNAWSPALNTFNSWDDNYEVARYNHYSTYVQEYLNSIYINGHHNDIADLVTDGLRVQRCQVKELKNKRKALQATSPIPNGQPIIEVIGKVMTKPQYDKDNFGQRELSPFVFFYGPVFDLDLVVDATDYGNDARFIRRSCLPNAIVRHVVAGGQAHFIAVATKEILETSEITIPYDYDYKKWNFCVDCACLRNNCPVRRFQKRMLKFKKQLQIGSGEHKKLKKLTSPESSPVKAPLKSPVRSPIKSPVRSPIQSPIRSPIVSPVQSPVKTPEKIEMPVMLPMTPEPEPTPLTPPTPSPPKMVRRSQVGKQHSRQGLKKAKRNSVQGRRKSMSNFPERHESAAKVRSLRVPSNPVDVETTEQEPITTPEPSSLRSSEVDPLTSPELAKEPAHVNPPEPASLTTSAATSTVTANPQQQPEKRKLTREERKMEAIMKAFEKMEKRQERKNSTLATKHDHHDEQKKTPKKEKKESQQEKKKQPQQQQQQPVEVKEQIEQEEEKPVEQPLQQEEQEVKKETKRERKKEKLVMTELSPVKVKEEPLELNVLPPEEKTVSPIKQEPIPPPQPDPIVEVSEEVKAESVEPVREVLKEEQEEVQPEAKEEELPRSKPTRDRPKGKKARKAAARRRTRLSTSAAVAPEPPLLAEDSSNSAPLPCPSASCPATPQADVLSPPSYRFLKTKRHLMNEWLSEKNDVKPATKTDPLEVAVDENMFVTCLPSPRNSMDRLRRNSQSNGGRPLVQSSAGSAKKRWLRQAMDEGSSDTGGMVSPVPGPSSGGMSPNPQASMPSPGGSPPVDFVTPLKKRRLARESMSCDSLTSESPTPTPSSSQPASSYFVNVTDSEESKLESFKSKNGFKSFFSPLRPDSIDEESSSKCSLYVPEKLEQCNSVNVRDSVESDLSDSCTGEVHASVLSETEVDKVNDSEVDSSESVKTGKKLALPMEESSEISDSDIKSSENNEISNVDSGQLHQHQKSANSEPDSSDSVCRLRDSPMEVECDSVSVNLVENQRTEDTVSNEVDSTETDGQRSKMNSMESAVSSQQENVALDSNCDSCVRERADSYTEDTRLSSSTLNLNNHPCTSSSSPCRHNICDSQKHGSPDKSCVDSSTDKGNQRSNGGNLDIAESSVLHTTEANVNSDINSTEEVSATDNLHTEFYLSDNNEEGSRTESSLVGSVGNFVLPSHYFNSTEMTVDSTTHTANTATGVMGNSIINSSGFSSLSSLSAYESDTMDVTSASDTYQGLYDRRQSEDSLLSMMEVGANSEVEQQMPPKEKKKVSLQEYRKRVKEKTVTTSALSSVTASHAKNSDTVSSTIKTPIKLDKLPSLPSLPMFEPQRKEFKSSSDLLSPIFNRKDKQEEIHRTMSLSERLRQEFGLDDSTDDEDHKTDHAGESEQAAPPPPPPPPPPPQQSQAKTAASSVSTSIPSLLSIKTFPTNNLKTSVGQTVSSSMPAVTSLGSLPTNLSTLSNSLSKTGLIGTSAATMVPSTGKSLASKILGDFGSGLTGTSSLGVPPTGKASLSSKILSDLGALLGKARNANANMVAPTLGLGSVSKTVPAMVPPPPGKGPVSTKAAADMGNGLPMSGLSRPKPLSVPVTSKGTTQVPVGIPPPPNKSSAQVPAGVPPPPSKGSTQVPGGVPPPPGKGSTQIPVGVPPPPGKGTTLGIPQAPASASKPPPIDSGVQEKVTKLAAQLAAALKAANGQAALGGIPAGQTSLTNASGQGGSNQNGPTLNNGHHNTAGGPQVFDYGHKSSGQFKRQNSLPGSNPSSSQTHYQHVNKASPPTSNLGAAKPFVGLNKLSPSLGNLHGHNKKSHGVSSSHLQGTSTSPSASIHSQQFGQLHQQSHNSHKKHSPHNVKFSKQHSTGHSHKYT